jgi:hypothetical protein
MPAPVPGRPGVGAPQGALQQADLSGVIADTNGSGSAHPDDILIVADLSEARLYPEFHPSQKFTTTMAARLQGRRFRKVWASRLAKLSAGWHQAESILTPASVIQGHGQLRVQLVEDWTAEESSVLDKIQRLPEENASASRDYGRGYAKAIRDVTALLTAEALAQAA